MIRVISRYTWLRSGQRRINDRPPGSELPYLDDAAIRNYLVDDLERDYVDDFDRDQEYQVETPVTDEGWANTRTILQEAANSGRPVTFTYTTKIGGTTTDRYVEPYGFASGEDPGTEIIVTWDRHMQDIRAFLVNNIHPGTTKIVEGDTFEKNKFVLRP